MSRIFTLSVLFVLLAVMAGRGSPDPALAQSGDPAAALADLGTAFTYQGRLVDGDAPANGSYDLRFILYTADSGGSQAGATQLIADLAISEGYFTVLLDFGAVFNGQELWLEVSVRPGSSTGAYSVLSPRQPLTTAPYAAYSLGAPWSGLSGVPAGFADGVDANTTYTAGNGLALNGGQFSVTFAGSGAATTAAHSDHNHLGQTWTGAHNALRLSGSFDTPDSPAPLVLSNASGSGLVIDSTGSTGIYVVSAERNGVRINSAGDSGISVGSSTYYGLSISSAGLAGVLVDSTAGDGFQVNSAGDDGVVVASAINDGVVVHEAGQMGVFVVTANSDGVWANTTNAAHYGGYFKNSAAGGAGLFALGGSNSAADLVLGGTSTSSDDGRILSDPDYLGSDLILVSNDAIQLDLDNDNDENGNFWVLNGANTTVFSINENGDTVATGSKSAAVQTQDFGPRKLYAMESPQNWFEDFGSTELVNGSATVAIEPVFAQTVNLNMDYYVFLTPLGDCPLYVAEKTSLDFTVRAMGGQDCSIAFDYRIVALRLGYEDLRLEAATDMQPQAEGEP